MGRVAAALPAALALLFSCTARAGQPDEPPPPLAIGNGSPVVMVFGIPRARGAGMTDAGSVDLDLTLDVASNFNLSHTSRESVALDGETTRAALQLRYGVSERWNLGVELPWIHHGGGTLDGFIINWHDLWGFPQHGRDEAPRGRLDYHYSRDGRRLVDVHDATGGPGDLVVSVDRRLADAAVLHTQVKLPTGDPDKLTGSGAADAAAGLELSRRWRHRWSSNLRAGVAYLGDGDVLPALRRNWAGYGGLDVVWQPLGALALRVQFDAHMSPYRDTGVDELSQWSGMLTAGGTWYITRRTALDLAVVENVPNPRAASDVTFQLRLRSTLGGRS